MAKDKKEDSRFNHPWLLAIGGACISSLLYDFYKSIPILSTIKLMVVSAYSFILTFFNLNIKVWWLLVFLTISCLIYFLIIHYTKQVKIPEFLTYKEDVFKKWQWTWDWVRNPSTNNWNINNLTPHCPECTTQLAKYQPFLYYKYYQCPRCNYKAIEDEVEDDYKIELLILDNVKNKFKNT